MFSTIYRKSSLLASSNKIVFKLAKRKIGDAVTVHAIEVFKAIAAARVLGTFAYYGYKESSHFLLGLEEGRKAHKNRALTKSLFANIPNLETTVRDENSYWNRFVRVHALSHSLVGSTPIRSYYDIRKQLFSVESDAKNLVVTIKTNTTCLVFYSNNAKEFQPIMLKKLLEATFIITKEELNKLDSSTSTAAEVRVLLDNMKYCKKLAFVNAETGAITVSRPRFIVLENDGIKSVSFIVQTETGPTLFGVPATPCGKHHEDSISNYYDDNRFCFFKELISKGYPLKYTVGEMFKTLPRRASYEVFTSGRMYLTDFALLLHKFAELNRINFFIQDPHVDEYPLTNFGKIHMKGTYIKPGPAGYFVQVVRVKGPEDLYRVTISFLDSSRYCELLENNFLDKEHNKKIRLC